MDKQEHHTNYEQTDETSSSIKELCKDPDPVISVRPDVEGSLTIADVLQFPVIVLKMCGAYIETEVKEDDGISPWSKVYSLFVALLLLWNALYNMEYFIHDPDRPGKRSILTVISIGSKIDFIIFPFILIATTKNLRKIFKIFTAFQTQHGFATDVEEAKNDVNRKLIYLFLISFTPTIGARLLLTLSHFTDLLKILNSASVSGTFEFFTNLVCHVYLSAIAMTTFLIIFILTTFITREVKIVDKKVKALREDCTVTASKLERLRRQQQHAGTLLRKSKLLAQSYTNAMFLVILIKILVFLWGLFHDDEVVMVKSLLSSVICQVLTVIWMIKSTIKAHDRVRLQPLIFSYNTSCNC